MCGVVQETTAAAEDMSEGQEKTNKQTNKQINK